MKTNPQINRVKPIFLCDMDDTLFAYSDTLTKALNLIRNPYEKEFTIENIRSCRDLPYIKERLRLITSQDGFYFNLPIIESGKDVLLAAQTIGYDCQILTKGPYFNSKGWGEKYDCIRKHFGPDIKVNIVQDKSLFYGAVLYDDYPDYFVKWLENRPRGLAIVPDSPVNRSAFHPRLIRHYNGNLPRVIDALKEEFEKRT